MSKQGIYYINDISKKENHAGNKVREDVNIICEEEGFKSIENLEEERFVSTYDKIKYMFTFSKLCKIVSVMMKTGRVTLLQYPFYFNPFMKYALSNYVRHNKTILLIHDVDSLRAWGKSVIDEEVNIFNNAKVLIVHNTRMKEKLLHLGVRTPMVELEIFDYLLKDKVTINNMQAEIAFAGNLSKSQFLNKINEIGVGVNLYGPGYNSKMSGTNVSYKGSYPADQIPYVLEGKFGLIWDGDSLDKCSGDTGTYLKYNNPHKLSLYIAAKLPVVVWKESAIADFVSNNNIGILVDSIFEIKERINVITNNDYELMKENVSAIQKRVCKGEYTKVAIKKAVSILNE